MKSGNGRKEKLREKLEKVFSSEQSNLLSDVIVEEYDELVKVKDFSELKEIVSELAKAQKESEKRLARIEIVLEELAEAQKRTEIRVEELTEAQRGSEKRLTRVEVVLEELAEAQKRTEIEVQKLAKGLDNTNSNVGGIARSLGYALENEAYRALPGILKEKYDISMIDKMIRTEIEGEEINIFGRGRKNGKDVLIVGEAETRLTSVKKFKQLENKIKAVRKKYEEEIVGLMITHFAKELILKKAEEKGIIVIQSFEW